MPIGRIVCHEASIVDDSACCMLHCMHRHCQQRSEVSRNKNQPLNVEKQCTIGNVMHMRPVPTLSAELTVQAQRV